MAVTVRLFAAARAAAGAADLTLPAGTLDSVLQEALQAHPTLAGVLPQCSYLLNELSCKDMQSRVNDGDVVDVLPPFAGG